MAICWFTRMQPIQPRLPPPSGSRGSTPARCTGGDASNSAAGGRHSGRWCTDRACWGRGWSLRWCGRDRIWGRRYSCLEVLVCQACTYMSSGLYIHCSRSRHAWSTSGLGAPLYGLLITRVALNLTRSYLRAVVAGAIRHFKTCVYTLPRSSFSYNRQDSDTQSPCPQKRTEGPCRCKAEWPARTGNGNSRGVSFAEAGRPRGRLRTRWWHDCVYRGRGDYQSS